MRLIVHNAGTKEIELATVHGSLLAQLLKRKVYDAECAGLYVSLSLGRRGAFVKVIR